MKSSVLPAIERSCSFHTLWITAKRVNYTKYLLVIPSNLRWDKRIDHICSRANNTLIFFGRSISIRDTNNKQHANELLARLILEYSSSICDPYTYPIAQDRDDTTTSPPTQKTDKFRLDPTQSCTPGRRCDRVSTVSSRRSR